MKGKERRGKVQKSQNHYISHKLCQMTHCRVTVVCRLPGSGPKLMTLLTLVMSSSNADDLPETFS